MATGPASTADDFAESIRTLIDRVADAKITQEMARRSREMSEIVAERGSDVGDRAAEAWRESRPVRRDATKAVQRASRDMARWSDRTWRKTIRPALRDLWSRRTVALGAAGAAVPAGREIVDTAAVRLGIREREERHWGAFFLGLLLGAVAGAIAALMLAPKRGDEMRRELSARADDVRAELATRADELVTKAKDAEWVPIFEREPPTNGQPAEPAVEAATDSVTEAAADAGRATGEVAEDAADETAEAINEAYDAVDKETRP